MERNPDLLSAHEAADYLTVSLDYVRRVIRYEVPVLMQLMDDNAYLLASGDCNLLSPSVTALVECLRGNGLDVMVDGLLKPGPWPLDVLGPAWDACRDAYAVSEFGNPSAIASVMPRFDCFAENGYLTALVVPASYGDPALLDLSNDGRCD